MPFRLAARRAAWEAESDAAFPGRSFLNTTSISSMAAAKVLEVERKGAKGSDLVARYAISGDMYVVMSQALAYLKNCHDNPLVGEMATLALHLMRERATLDMNPEGIVLSTSLIS